MFTGPFGPGSGEVLFDRICRENGIRHLLTAPRSPTTTGKVERFHKTLKKDFLADRHFESLEEAQAAIDGWVVEYTRKVGQTGRISLANGRVRRECLVTRFDRACAIASWNSV